ncbi:FtsX-like permease family protein [Thermostilla marina]
MNASRWSLGRFVIASLRTDGMRHLAVAAGAAVACAVLVGALIVGDSMRESLRRLAIDRLGKIDTVVTPGRFFRAELADEWTQTDPVQRFFEAATPAIMIDVGIDNAEVDPPRRANHVRLVGCRPQFYAAFPQQPHTLPGGRDIVLNEETARLLHVEVGDRVILRLPRVRSIPAESGLGRRTELVRATPVTVVDIIPDEGLGRFGIEPSQTVPRLAFADLDWLADHLEQPGKANTLILVGRNAEQPASVDARGLAAEALSPLPLDYGLRITEDDRGFFQISSDRLILDGRLDAAVRDRLSQHEVRPVFVYLANAIRCGDKEVPYSIVAAMQLDIDPPLGPFLDPAGKPVSTPGDDEIVLNDWAARELGAAIGDEVELTWFAPETKDGRYLEEHATLTVSGIVALKGAAADPTLTPEVPDITDRDSIADWDPPFPFDASKIRDQDEAYWDAHRATPKAFVSPATGKRLWANRFGEATSLRVVPSRPMTADQLAAEMRLIPQAHGFLLRPVKREALAASVGTTSFSGLFLGFNMFVMAAGLILLGLLFRLAVERRAKQLGIVAATGWPPRRIAQWLAAEGVVVAGAGSVVGAIAGILYAKWMVWGLTHLWTGAIVTPFLRYHAKPVSIVGGALAGFLVAMSVILWQVRAASRRSPKALLSGEWGGVSLRRGRPLFRRGVAILFFMAAVALGFIAMGTGNEQEQAGAFFGAGMLVLVAWLVWFHASLLGGARAATRFRSLAALAARNVARRRGRSVATAALVASACFLITAISAFHLDPEGELGFDGGAGGFRYYGETDLPLYFDLNVPENRTRLGFSKADSQALAAAEFYQLRMRAGQQASCLNLYKPTEPRVLGVPDRMIGRGGFRFTKTAADSPAERENPWLLLQRPAVTDAEGVLHVPAIVDDATAKYSYHLWKGVGEHIDVVDTNGRIVRLEIVGLLANSIFQGDVLIGEPNFKAAFPGVGGYRVIVVECSEADAPLVQQTCERVLGDYGLAFQSCRDRLAAFFAVQNTYLLTFQMIGGLGLLLGTFGLIAVQLRNVLERRGELAMMRAVGFSPKRLARMVLWENTRLLFAGLIGGIVAAIVAVAPHLVDGRAELAFGAVVPSLAGVVVVGLVAGWIAVRAVTSIDLQTALRRE